MNSGALESRGISHETEATESEFIQSLGESGGAKEIYWSKARVLPEEYITICGMRAWSAFAKESLEQLGPGSNFFGNLKATSGVFSKVA